jgi:UTP--glucose-1-phosphate uridylyltransferase
MQSQFVTIEKTHNKPRGAFSRMSYPKIRKAVFPAAGLGTRFLPATKAIPKEMLCLVDKPLIQYGVEEAVAAGCTEIIIITGRDKAAMEDHFDYSPELEASLEAKGKKALLEIVHSVSKLAKIVYTRQPHPLGLGHAVLMAKELVGDEPFCVLLPDDIVDAKVPCMKQMVEAFYETGSSILASEVVEGPAISAYGCLDCTPVASNPRLLDVKGMVEKLTDAIKALLAHEKVYGFHYEGKRHDAGDKLGFLKATVELGLKRKDLGPDFRAWLKELPI